MEGFSVASTVDIQAKMPAQTSQADVVQQSVDQIAESVKDGSGELAQVVCRKMGDTELSYYLPSRESGVNDMYLHIGFRAPANLVARSRVRVIWAILRQRHPLLAAKVRMEDYDNVLFEYQPLDSVDDALTSADAELEYRSQAKDDLISSYLNGPRTLSDERLTYLFISSPEYVEGKSTGELEFNWMICTTHYIGDGMALHATANDFFTLLGSDKDESQLRALLHSELTTNQPEIGAQLPLELESRLPETRPQRIFGAIATVDHLLNQRKQIGGHVFPRRSGQTRHTIVPTVSFDADKTKKMLKKCKENGVSISSAVFALCNIAWARTNSSSLEEPALMYSALNLRPYLKANEKLNNSYWFLAIGYFNIILPSFLPKDSSKHASTFWHRARSVKTQTAKVAKNPMIVSRSQLMAKERGLRARIWGMQDDGVECNLSMPKPVIFENDTPAPSKALIGLSLLGNLDGTYKHQAFSSIILHTLTTGSRQRQGAMLLFGYTFVGKLWLSLGYDANGFDDEIVQRFWKHVLAGVDELLVD
ncbi:hypothetical protein BKA70DRAFT_1251121 [Coprinopsis sp. MPI-PUGE-AT-0042]|nr:hypothetical protein BKA70DRAFT_1251121 [Coprinopsis sp. MPI-PUGE-AT-0042]